MSDGVRVSLGGLLEEPVRDPSVGLMDDLPDDRRQSSSGDQHDGVGVVNDFHLCLAAEHASRDEHTHPSPSEASDQSGHLVRADARIGTDALGLSEDDEGAAAHALPDVVGWQLSKSLRTDLALDALEMGLWTRKHAGEDTTPQIRAPRSRSKSPGTGRRQTPRRGQAIHE